MKKEFDLPSEIVVMIQKLANKCNISEDDLISTIVLSTFMQSKKKFK